MDDQAKRVVGLRERLTKATIVSAKKIAIPTMPPPTLIHIWKNKYIATGRN